MDNLQIEAHDKMNLLLLDIKKLEMIHCDFDDEIDSTKLILEESNRNDVLQLAQFDRTKLKIEIEFDYILKIKQQAEELLESLERAEEQRKAKE